MSFFQLVPNSVTLCDKLTGAINLVWLDWPDRADWHLSSGRQTY